MEQHPVPQHIASYEFRLVGEMTLKQFSYLAGGGVVALIFYSSPLPGYFKWPLVIFFGFLGFALAFLPIQERPLSQWIIAFTKATFSPTQYIWQKKGQQPEIFQTLPKKLAAQEAPVAPADQTQMAEYLKTLPQKPTKTPLEQQEKSSLEQIMNLFQLVKAPGITITTPSTPTFTSQPLPPAPTHPPRPPVALPPEPEIIRPAAEPTVRPVSFAPPPIKTGRPVILPEKPGGPKKPTVEAKTSPHLPIPGGPTQPNILVGMVLDKEEEMIEGAILEIRNSQGIPVRALKTNRLGQFRIATPLVNDVYEIEIEKEGYQFDIIKIEARGEIIQPIEIRAKG